MKIRKTKNNNLVIQVLSGRSNVFLIATNDNLVLVDTGKASSFTTLFKNIVSLGIKFEDIAVLILTHTHFDHCQSAQKIKEQTDCKIITSCKSADYIKNGYAPLPKGTSFPTKLISKLGRRIGKRKFGFEPFEADILVHNTYHLNIPNCEINIIETPGHSMDSISIIVDNEIALVGDAMFGVFKNSIFPPYSDDIGLMIKSWAKLLHTTCTVFLPGHGSAISKKRLQKQYEIHVG